MEQLLQPSNFKTFRDYAKYRFDRIRQPIPESPPTELETLAREVFKEEPKEKIVNLVGEELPF